MERRVDLPRILSSYDEETLKLYSLAHYAGIMIDPSLFKNMVDLLKAGLDMTSKKTRMLADFYAFFRSVQTLTSNFVQKCEHF